jgi:hypothetical protein
MNKPFNSQAWGQRYKVMGDTAESSFELIHPHAHRMGINRPNFSIAALSQLLRHTPDYLLPNGFYEVMGVSSRTKDATLKLKFEKLHSLKQWTLFGDGYLWVWDSNKKRYWCASIDEWEHACAFHASVKYFDDNNKPYWDLPILHFPCEPTTGIDLANA